MRRHGRGGTHNGECDGVVVVSNDAVSLHAVESRSYGHAPDFREIKMANMPCPMPAKDTSMGHARQELISILALPANAMSPESR